MEVLQDSSWAQHLIQNRAASSIAVVELSMAGLMLPWSFQQKMLLDKGAYCDLNVSCHSCWLWQSCLCFFCVGRLIGYWLFPAANYSYHIGLKKKSTIGQNLLHRMQNNPSIMLADFGISVGMLVFAIHIHWKKTHKKLSFLFSAYFYMTVVKTNYCLNPTN